MLERAGAKAGRGGGRGGWAAGDGRLASRARTIQCRRPRPGRLGRAVDALRVGGANVGGGAEARPQPRKHKREGGPRNRRMTFGMGVGTREAARSLGVPSGSDD